MAEIPKPPERGEKTAEEYITELSRWANKMYDVVRYMSETGGTNNNGNV